jgi:hypothetical protein
MQAAEVFTTLDIELKPDPSRTVIRPFGFAYPEAFRAGRPSRAHAVLQRIEALDPAMRTRMLGLMQGAMRERHRNSDQVFQRRFEEMREELGNPQVDETIQLLIGAYFSQEYAFESAALFNPSIVRLPDAEPTSHGGVRISPRSRCAPANGPPTAR